VYQWVSNKHNVFIKYYLAGISDDNQRRESIRLDPENFDTFLVRMINAMGTMSLKIDRTNLMRFSIGVMSNFFELLDLHMVSRFVDYEIRDVTFMPRVQHGKFFR